MAGASVAAGSMGLIGCASVRAIGGQMSKDWAHNIIKQVGNYDEMYERSMGDGPLAIGIARAGSQNDLWTRGGLQYSPPFR